VNFSTHCHHTRVGLNDERCLPFTVHPVTGGEPSPTCRTHTRGVSHTLVEPPTQPQMTIDQHLLAALSVQGRFPHCNSNLMSTRQSRASSCDLLIVSTPPLTTAVTILEYLSAYLIVAYLALGTQAIALSQMDAVTTGNARPPNPITLFAGSKVCNFESIQWRNSNRPGSGRSGLSGCHRAH